MEISQKFDEEKREVIFTLVIKETEFIKAKYSPIERMLMKEMESTKSIADILSGLTVIAEGIERVSVGF